MKNYTFRTIAFSGLFAILFNLQPLIASTVYRSVDQFERTISKQYNVNADAEVVLKNKYGKIHVNTWDKNEVTIEVVISIDARSKEVAEGVFDKIEIKTSGTSSRVTVETTFKSKVKDSSKNKDLQINYTVNIPRKASVDIRNRFGDIYLGDILGSSKIDLAYGSIRAGDLNNKSNTIELQFSDGQFKFIAMGTIDLQYSEMDIDKAGSLTIDSQFSELDIGPAGELVIDSQYDEIDLEGASKVKIDTQFSEIDIKQVASDLFIKASYTDVDVELISPEMKSVFVDDQFGDISLGLAPGLSYILDAKGSFSDINLPENFKVREKTKGNTSFRYVGTVGDDPKDRTVTLISSYGDIDLN